MAQSTSRDEAGVLRLRVDRCSAGGYSGAHEYRSRTGACLACGDGSPVYEAPSNPAPLLCDVYALTDVTVRDLGDGAFRAEAA